MLQKITPEEVDVADIYIKCGHSVQQTARATGLPVKQITQLINSPTAKTYLNQLYAESGYRNRFKIGGLLDKIIQSKLEEAEETEIFSKADLLQLLQFAHKMRVDQAKLQKQSSSGPTVNIANFGQGNYGQLVSKLINGKSK